jgi:hypothetical protein
LERARVLTKIFGQQGQKAFLALSGSGGKALSDLTKKLEASGTAFRDKFGRPLGAAAYMAQKRLNNVKGAVTLFKSSVESFFITIMQGFLGPMKNRLQTITAGFNNLLFAMQALEKDDSLSNQEKLAQKYGYTITQVALGLKDGIAMFKSMWATITETVKKFVSYFSESFGAVSIRTITKIITGLGLFAVSLTPIILGVVGVGAAIGAIVSIVTGLAAAISGAFLPIIAIVGAIGVGILVMSKYGEGFRQKVFEIYTVFKKVFSEAWAWLKMLFNGLKPIVADLLSMIMSVGGKIVSALKMYYGILFRIGTAVVNSYVAVFRFLRPIVAYVMKWVRVGYELGKVLVHMWLTPLKGIWWVLKTVGLWIWDKIKPGVYWVVKGFGAVLSVVVSAGKAIKGYVIEPFQAFAGMLADALAMIEPFAKKLGIPVAGLRSALQAAAGRTVSLSLPGVADAKSMTKNLFSVGTQAVTAGASKRVIADSIKRSQYAAGLAATEAGQKGARVNAWMDKLAGKINKAVGERPITLNNNNKMSVDGRCVSQAQARHDIEMKERAGFNTTPWQGRAVKVRSTQQISPAGARG